MTEYALSDADGTVRWRGTIEPAPGGSQPVTCLLYTGSIDIHDSGQHPLLWGTMIDNPWDYNEITVIPAELGLTFLIDDTAATITTTEAGAWTFSLVLALPADATWAGTLVLEQNTQMEQSGSAIVPNPKLAVSEGVAYPAGANIVPQVVTEVEGTADPLNAQGFLTIVRFA